MSQYETRFGHGIPVFALQRYRTEELIRLLDSALKSGQPVKAWAEYKPNPAMYEDRILLS
jgi:hypothetical protein